MKDGGPAFPRTGNDYQAGDNHKYHPGHEGMSLRDWFAGQALAGVVGEENMHCSFLQYAKEENLDVDDVTARFCYGMANAMLKAREESK